MKRLGYAICSIVVLGYVVWRLAVEGYDIAALSAPVVVIYPIGYWLRLCDVWTREYSSHSYVSESPYRKARALIRSLVWFVHPLQVFTWICGKHHYVRYKESEQRPNTVGKPLT